MGASRALLQQRNAFVAEHLVDLRLSLLDRGVERGGELLVVLADAHRLVVVQRDLGAVGEREVVVDHRDVQRLGRLLDVAGDVGRERDRNVGLAGRHFADELVGRDLRVLVPLVLKVHQRKLIRDRVLVLAGLLDHQLGRRLEAHRELGELGLLDRLPVRADVALVGPRDIDIAGAEIGLGGQQPLVARVDAQHDVAQLLVQAVAHQIDRGLVEPDELGLAAHRLRHRDGDLVLEALGVLHRVRRFDGRGADAERALVLRRGRLGRPGGRRRERRRAG